MWSGSMPFFDWPLLEWHRVLRSRDAEETRAFLGSMAFRFAVAARDAAQLDVCLNRGLLPGEPPTEPLKFVPTMNLADGYGRRLAQILSAAVIEFERTNLVRWSPTAMIEFAEFVVTNLLLFHPHNYSDALRRSDRMITPRDINRAVDYLEAHVDAPVTVADLVAASQVSGRTLFQHFRDFKGMSPMRYLRNARFAKVRDALLRAEAEESVTAIASACGFTHLSRFAVEYRRRFGERPSDTLRRNRKGREIACGEAFVTQCEEADDGSAAARGQVRRRRAPVFGARERAAVEVRRRLHQRGET